MKNRREAFTLIEMLVVMLIIATLMALLLAGLSAARDSGKRTQARNEISQIQVAIGDFKGKMGEAPAVNGGGPSGEFRLCTNYSDASGNWLAWPEVEYLLSIFPNMSKTDNGLRIPGSNTPITNDSPHHLNGNETLFMFLTGGGVYTNRSGFSNSPAQPFKPPTTSPGEQRKGPFFQSGDTARWAVLGGGEGNGFRDPWGTYYAVLGYSAYSKRTTGSAYPAAVTSFGVAPFKDSSGKFYNETGIQIISAGKNKKFGPGGIYVPGQGAYSGGDGEDDLANFRESILGTDR